MFLFLIVKLDISVRKWWQIKIKLYHIQYIIFIFKYTKTLEKGYCYICDLSTAYTIYFGSNSLYIQLFKCTDKLKIKKIRISLEEHKIVEIKPNNIIRQNNKNDK